MSRNLLVYEADVAMSDALTTLFSAYNFEVFVASSEGRVQEALGKAKMDLFIIRAENPGMKGTDTTKTYSARAAKRCLISSKPPK